MFFLFYQNVSLFKFSRNKFILVHYEMLLNKNNHNTERSIRGSLQTTKVEGHRQRLGQSFDFFFFEIQLYFELFKCSLLSNIIMNISTLNEYYIYSKPIGTISKLKGFACII